MTPYARAIVRVLSGAAFKFLQGSCWVFSLPTSVSTSPFLLATSFILLLLHVCRAALGTYAVYLLGLTEPGQDALSGRVTDRVSWFYAVTLVFNVLLRTILFVDVKTVTAQLPLQGAGA